MRAVRTAQAVRRILCKARDLLVLTHLFVSINSSISHASKPYCLADCCLSPCPLVRTFLLQSYFFVAFYMIDHLLGRPNVSWKRTQVHSIPPPPLLCRLLKLFLITVAGLPRHPLLGLEAPQGRCRGSQIILDTPHQSLIEYVWRWSY